MFWVIILTTVYGRRLQHENFTATVTIPNTVIQTQQIVYVFCKSMCAVDFHVPIKKLFNVYLKTVKIFQVSILITLKKNCCKIQRMHGIKCIMVSNYSYCCYCYNGKYSHYCYHHHHYYHHLLSHITSCEAMFAILSKHWISHVPHL